MKVDPRFLATEGREIFTGNELLLKGALEVEGGVHLLGGYPGSPVADFFNAMAQIKDLLSEKGIRAVINNNEALAAAMLNGSQSVGCRAVIAMKSVGVHVAADALALGNLAGADPDGGAVVVYGDDPWSDSTQVPADSRYISKHLFIPVVEPANPQEVKDFVDLALKLSRRSELYAGLIIPTNLADGGGSVECGPNRFPSFNTRQRMTLDTAAIDLDKRVLLPPKTWWQEATLNRRHADAVRIARELELNRIEHAGDDRRPIGFITSGMAHGYLTQALWEMGLLGSAPVLKLGMSYPLDRQFLRELAERCQRIVVVEERRGFIEEQAAEALTAARQARESWASVELWGKTFPHGLEGIPDSRGLHPSILIERLAPLIERVWPDSGAGDAVARERETVDLTGDVSVGPLPPRLPSFCPGCPHRDSSSVCLQIKEEFADAGYMRRRHGAGPVDLLFHGDIGCYTMLMYPPNTPLMHNLSGMGLGGGTGSGTDPFVDNKQVVFMGDSTFFHSGQLAISQAIKLGQDITFIILDNSTTAMTGHQPTPNVDYDILGNPTSMQDIEEIIAGMAGNSNLTLARVDPEKRDEYKSLLEKTFLADGVKIIIADKECGITRMRRKRREERGVAKQKGYLPSWDHMNVCQELCTFCLACTEYTGCPGLKHVRTDYGLRMDTDLSWCVNDGACERIGACSAFEQVTVRRKRPPRSKVPELALDDIPEPHRSPPGELWRCCLTGVGGMGLGVATSILVRAGHKEGYRVIFLDKKGLAIRNGGTLSQVVYKMDDQPVTALVPYGKADLLLGIDVLEAARALDPTGRSRVASRDRTAAVVNTDKIPTIAGLMGREDFDVAELERLIRDNTRGDDYLARNISRICERYLGSKLYANIMMLGFAFQKGLIPVSMHSMAWAIKDTIRADFRKNLYAFNMGRKLVEQPDLFQGPPRRTDWRDVLEDRCRWTVRRYAAGQRLADELRALAARTVTALDELAESAKRDVVVRLYDCMRWGGMDYAQRYADAVAQTHRRDSAEHRFAATLAVIENLATAMLIKDPVFMAELGAAPEKKARDREKYSVNPANGDRIVYRHLWNVELNLGRWKVPVRLRMRDWMLEVLKRSRWLRALRMWRRDDHRRLAQYEQRVEQFGWDNPHEYYAQVAMLSSPHCMDCMHPRCREAGCPLQSEIPEWIDLAERKRWRQAWELLESKNNFPEITARVCPAPCEVSCKQELNEHPVQVRRIERQVADKALDAGWIAPRPAEIRTDHRVAIIGSGPAGLTAAQELARGGHSVVVFEREETIGGLMRWGIPSHRLEDEVLDRRVEQLAAEGVEFRTGVEVGRDVSGAELLEQFDAVLLATGALSPRGLNVPGREKRGVHHALEFLREHNNGQPRPALFARNKVVTVIGGGETGNDCVEIARLQGAKSVHQLEIMPEPVVRQHTWTEPEGDRVDRRWCVATHSLGGNDEVTHVDGVGVEWRQTASGRVMREHPERAFRLETDLVLLATGFDATLDEQLSDQLGLKTENGRVHSRGNVTDRPGVFVAGDLDTGPSLVSAAINSGRKAADRIHAYLARRPAAAPLAAAKW